MAPTILTIEIPEAVFARCVKALCLAGGLPESPANAKTSLISYIRSTVVEQERARVVEAAQTQPIIPPEGLK